MVFCNVLKMELKQLLNKCHNPYFSRWFSAILETYKPLIGFGGHNPYFSRWFSAIKPIFLQISSDACHNPYFSRWFSAIRKTINILSEKTKVTILILVDGFLQ